MDTDKCCVVSGRYNVRSKDTIVQMGLLAMVLSGYHLRLDLTRLSVLSITLHRQELSWSNLVVGLLLLF